MKRTFSFSGIVAKFKIGSLALCFVQVPLAAETYYVNVVSGNDNNPGTSQEQPFRSLDRVNGVKLQAGDQVLLARGLVYPGTIEWKDLAGSREKPIILGSYNDQKKGDSDDV